MENKLEQVLDSAIRTSNLEDLDALWALLKYPDIGILRKVKAMCQILNIRFDYISDLLPKNNDGWILDRPTRHIIHDILIKYS